MDEKEEHTKGRNGSKYTPVAVAVIGAFIGSSGTVALVFNSPVGQEIARPDPFTGTQAATLVRRIERIEAHIEKHPYDLLHDRRITELEAHYEDILRQLDRIEGKVNQR